VCQNPKKKKEDDFLFINLLNYSKKKVYL